MNYNSYQIIWYEHQGTMWSLPSKTKCSGWKTSSMDFLANLKQNGRGSGPIHKWTSTCCTDPDIDLLGGYYTVHTYGHIPTTYYLRHMHPNWFSISVLVVKIVDRPTKLVLFGQPQMFCHVTGHLRNLNWRYQNMAKNMVQYPLVI